MAGSFNQTANLQLQVDKRSLAQVERQISRAVGDASKINFGIKPGSKSPLGSIGRDINEFTGALDAANKRVIAFGASVAVIEGVRQAFVQLVATTVEVEKRFADINNILNLSSRSLEEFSKAVFNTAKNTGQSLQTAADAAVELSRQGLGAEETLKRLNDALILSRLSGLDAAKSVEALTATINSFNKQILTSSEIVNKFAELDARFAVSSADLAEGLSRVGSSAQEAGLSLEEVSALITSVQQTTARGGSVIGNAFKTIFTRISRSDVQQALNEIGVATQNADGSFRNQAAVLQDLAKVYRTLPDAQRAYIAETVAGVYQSNIFKAAINDLGNSFSIYRQALETATKATDGAIQRNEELNKTLSATANEALLNLQQIAATIGNIAVAPNLKGLLDFFNQLAGEINATDTQSIGAKLGKGIISGIGEFIGGPGAILLFAAITSVFVRISKLAAGSLKDLLGINNQFQQTTFLQQQALQFLQQQPQILQKIQQGTLSIAAAQQQYVQYLREAQVLQGNIVAGTLSRGLGSSYESAAAKLTRKQQRGFASGFMPSEREMIKSGAYGTPSTATVKKGNVRGVGQIEYNSSEKIIRDFPIKGKDSVIPNDPKRARETFERFGYAAAGYIPNFAKYFSPDDRSDYSDIFAKYSEAYLRKMDKLPFEKKNEKIPYVPVIRSFARELYRTIPRASLRGIDEDLFLEGFVDENLGDFQDFMFSENKGNYKTKGGPKGRIKPKSIETILNAKLTQFMTGQESSQSLVTQFNSIKKQYTGNEISLAEAKNRLTDAVLSQRAYSNFPTDIFSNYTQRDMDGIFSKSPTYFKENTLNALKEELKIESDRKKQAQKEQDRVARVQAKEQAQRAKAEERERARTSILPAGPRFSKTSEIDRILSAAQKLSLVEDDNKRTKGFEILKGRISKFTSKSGLKEDVDLYSGLARLGYSIEGSVKENKAKFGYTNTILRSVASSIGPNAFIERRLKSGNQAGAFESLGAFGGKNRFNYTSRFLGRSLASGYLPEENYSKSLTNEELAAVLVPAGALGALFFGEGLFSDRGRRKFIDLYTSKSNPRKGELDWFAGNKKKNSKGYLDFNGKQIIEFEEGQFLNTLIHNTLNKSSNKFIKKAAQSGSFIKALRGEKSLASGYIPNLFSFFGVGGRPKNRLDAFKKLNSIRKDSGVGVARGTASAWLGDEKTILLNRMSEEFKSGDLRQLSALASLGHELGHSKQFANGKGRLDSVWEKIWKQSKGAINEDIKNNLRLISERDAWKYAEGFIPKKDLPAFKALANTYYGSYDPGKQLYSLASGYIPNFNNFAGYSNPKNLSQRDIDQQVYSMFEQEGDMEGGTLALLGVLGGLGLAGTGLLGRDILERISDRKNRGTGNFSGLGLNRGGIKKLPTLSKRATIEKSLAAGFQKQFVFNNGQRIQRTKAGFSVYGGGVPVQRVSTLKEAMSLLAPGADLMSSSIQKKRLKSGAFASGFIPNFAPSLLGRKIGQGTQSEVFDIGAGFVFKKDLKNNKGIGSSILSQNKTKRGLQLLQAIANRDPLLKSFLDVELPNAGVPSGLRQAISDKGFFQRKVSGQPLPPAAASRLQTLIAEANMRVGAQSKKQFPRYDISDINSNNAFAKPGQRVSVIDLFVSGNRTKGILDLLLAEKGIKPGTKLPISQRNPLQVKFFNQLKEKGIFNPNNLDDYAKMFARLVPSAASGYIPNFANSLLNQKYNIGDLIGEGSFKKVYNINAVQNDLFSSRPSLSPENLIMSVLKRRNVKDFDKMRDLASLGAPVPTIFERGQLKIGRNIKEAAVIEKLDPVTFEEIRQLNFMPLSQQIKANETISKIAADTLSPFLNSSRKTYFGMQGDLRLANLGVLKTGNKSNVINILAELAEAGTITKKSPPYEIRRMQQAFDEGLRVLDAGFLNPKKPSASSGFIPNFANPLQAAINREMAAGVPKSRIRLGFDKRIGLGVYNTKDEPAGLSQGVNRELRRGRNPKMAGSYIPNFAEESFDASAGAAGFGLGGLGSLIFALTAFRQEANDSAQQAEDLAKQKLKQARIDSQEIKRTREIAKGKIEAAKASRLESEALKREAVEKAASAEKIRAKAEPILSELEKRRKEVAKELDFIDKRAAKGIPPIPFRQEALQKELKSLNRSIGQRNSQISKAFKLEQESQRLTSSSITKKQESRNLAIEGRNVKKLSVQAANIEAFTQSAREEARRAIKQNSTLNRIGSKAGGAGLALSLIGPTVGGLAASGFNQDTRNGRIGATLAQGVGNIAGFAGSGAVLGSSFGGPIGALIGGGVGAAAGIGLTTTDVINQINQTYPELQAALEKNVEKFSKLQDGAQRYLTLLEKQANFLENGDRNSFTRSQVEIAKILKDFEPEVQKQLASFNFGDIEKAQKLLAEQLDKKTSELAAQEFATKLVTEGEKKREIGFNKFFNTAVANPITSGRIIGSIIPGFGPTVGTGLSIFEKPITKFFKEQFPDAPAKAAGSRYTGKNAQLFANVDAQSFSGLAIEAIQRITGENEKDTELKRKEAFDKLRQLTSDGTNVQEISKFVNEIPGIDSLANSAFKIQFDKAAQELGSDFNTNLLSVPLEEILRDFFNVLAEQAKKEGKIFPSKAEIERSFSQRQLNQELSLGDKLFQLERKSSRSSFLSDALSNAGISTGENSLRRQQLLGLSFAKESESESARSNLNQLQLELEKQIALADRFTQDLSLEERVKARGSESREAIANAEAAISEETQRVAQKLSQINEKFQDELEKIELSKLVSDFFKKSLSESLNAQRNVVQSGRNLRDINRQIRLAEFTARTGREPNQFEQNQALYGDAFISSSEINKREALEQLEILNFDRQIQKIEYENAIKQALILEAESKNVDLFKPFIDGAINPIVDQAREYINRNPQKYQQFLADKGAGLASYESAANALNNEGFRKDFSSYRLGLGSNPSILNVSAFKELDSVTQQAVKAISLYSENFDEVINSYEAATSKEAELIKLRDKSIQQYGEQSEATQYFNRLIGENKEIIERSSEAYKFATNNYQEYLESLYSVTPQRIAGIQRERLGGLISARSQTSLALQSGATPDEVRSAFANQAEAAFANKNYAEFFGRTLDAQLYATWEDGIKDIANLTTSTFQNIESGLTDALQGVINGTTTAEDAFKSLALSLAQDVQKQAIQGLIKQLFGGLQNALAQAGGGQNAAGGQGGTSNWLNSLFSIFGSAASSYGGARANGGLIQKFASGGMVMGGSGVRDDVPAMLSSGEYVLKRSAVRKYGPDFMEALNGGYVRAFADGGPTDAKYGKFLSTKAGAEGFVQSINLADKFDMKGKKDLPVGVGLSEYALTQTKLGQEAIAARDAYKQAIATYKQELRAFNAQYTSERLAWQIGIAYASAALSGYGASLGAQGNQVGSSIASEAGGLSRNLSASSGVGAAPQYSSSLVNQGNSFDIRYGQRGATYPGFAFANGGMARGTDRVPAMLTGGEYVINKDSVDRYGLPFMNSINRGMVDPLKVQYRADGGPIGKASGSAGKASSPSGGNTIQNNNQISISITSNSSGQTQAEVEGESTFEGGKDKQNSQITDRERAEIQKNLSQQIKNSVIEIIEKESRPNGILAKMRR